MNAQEYHLMRQVEDSHWWYAVLRRFVAVELKQHLGGRDQVRILDAGCGTGGMMETLRRLEPSWHLTGLDVSALALEHTRQRGFADLVQGSADALPFADISFDVVISLDVIYFKGVDEVAAMSEIHRVLKPEGLLVLNVPAFEALRGRHDVAVSAARRYTPAGVSALLANAGFREFQCHCWNLWMFIPIFCWRQWSRNSITVRSDLFQPPSLLNALLVQLGHLDMTLCRALHSPVGTSILAVGCKNPTQVLPPT
jgi:SAM-dependent methyltransferase